MTNEELVVMAQLASELHEMRERRDAVKKERDDIELDLVDVRGKRDEALYECNKLREREARAQKASEVFMAERDEARSKLREVVVVLNEMWQDYKYINFKSKADKERAKRMAAKIKAFSEAHKLELVQDKNGKWGVK